MIRLFILILILAFVCAVKIIDDMIKNNVIDEIAKGKDRG